MRRTALTQPRVLPSPRAARKSEWLRSALAHHHCPDPGVDNEIVVLATGIDQYLQEVFHHLVSPNRNDTMSAEDFTALCAVLGLTGERGQRTVKEETGAAAEDEEDEEFMDVCSGLPCQLSFKDFHARLCGYFRVRSGHRGTGECAWRLPVTEDTELVERQIRLRWPRVRRRKCVSFDLTRDQNGAVNRSIRGRTADESGRLLYGCSSSYHSSVIHVISHTYALCTHHLLKRHGSCLKKMCAEKRGVIEPK